MSLLTSGYMDDDGFDGPDLRYIRNDKPSSETVNVKFTPPVRSSPFSKRPSFNDHSARKSEPNIESKSIMTERMSATSFFSANELAAMANVVSKAPKILTPANTINKVSSRRSDASRARPANDPWSFPKLPIAAAAAKAPVVQQGRKSQAPRAQHIQPESAVDPVFEIEDEVPEHRFQPRKGQPEPAPSTKPKTKPKDRNGEAKNKKQARKDARAKKLAEKASHKAVKEKKKELKARSRDKSPTPSGKVDGWDIDPDSKPASNTGTSKSFSEIDDQSEGTKASSKHLKSRHSAHKSQKSNAWDSGGGFGDMFDEGEKHGSQRSLRSHESKTARSFRREELQMDAGDWAGSERRGTGLRKTASRHSHSGSRRSGSKRSNDHALETIREDEAIATEMSGSWGQEDQLQHASRATSSHRSRRSHRSGPYETNGWDATSEQSKHSRYDASRHSNQSRKSKASKPGWEGTGKHGSVLSKANTLSYKAPTVEDITEEDWEEKEQARSQRSKSTEKVNEWFDNLVAASEKISHRSHSRSHSSRGRTIGWEEGRVPSDVSLGTGYGRKKSRELGAADWDKRTSSGSSNKAELGVKQPSIRSGRSSRKSWGICPPSEVHGDW